MARIPLVKYTALVLAGLLLTTPSYAEGDLLDDDFDEAGDLFADDEFGGDDFSVDGILASQNELFQLSVEHSLALNPKASYKRTNHTTDLRLSSERSLGLLGYGEIELKAMQYWPGDVNKPAASPLSTVAIETLIVQYSLAETSAKVGRYMLSWGEVEGAGVLDVVNPAPNATSGGTSFEPQWLLSGSYYLPTAEVSGFINLDPSVSIIPNVSLGTPITKEWGVKYGATDSGGDWALYFGQLLPNNPVINLSTGQASAKTYDLVGFSWNKAIDDDLLKVDVAYKTGLQHNLGYTGLVTDKRLDAAIGLELNAGDRQWNMSLTAKHLPNYQSSYLTAAVPPVASNPTDWTYTIGVSESFKNDEFNGSIMHFGTPNGSLQALTAVLTWKPTDQWQASVSYATMRAKANTAYALMDGLQRLTLKSKFSY
ncbi:MAG: hypothetical protein NZ738_04125 [Oceanospirillaceae bacterium]|nr:hypothetical protein [Oceanospirillaceae bacterium]